MTIGLSLFERNRNTHTKREREEVLFGASKEEALFCASKVEALFGASKTESLFGARENLLFVASKEEVLLNELKSVEKGIVMILAVVEDTDTRALLAVLGTILDYCLESARLRHVDSDRAPQLFRQYEQLWFACVYIQVCKYIYICTYIYVYMFIYIHICIC